MPLRIVAIIHLCIAFSALLFDMGYPFMGQLFEDKRLNGIYETVLQDRDHFQQLPYQKQVELEEGHHTVSDRMHTSFGSKLRQAISIIMVELPPFHKAWIFFSILIPIFILMKIDGAHRAAWILPFITFIFGFNQIAFNPFDHELFENSLFPNEQTIVDDYLDEPLATSILTQKEQLLKGWHLYVINKWAKEAPSSDSTDFTEQLAKGLYAFNLARIDAINLDSAFPPYLRKKGSFFMMSFFVWNFFFAWFVNRRRWYRT